MNVAGPRSRELYRRAVELMPAGVNSPVRAFRSVGGQPLFYAEASGCRVTDVDGNEYSGQLVYDIDESESWEALNGRDRDVEFAIPFAMIASVAPYGRDSAVITLKNGHEVELEDSQDVSESHDGVLVLDEDGEIHEWIAWDDIEIVRFE